MQIQSGTAAVTNGSALVTASADNDWSQAKVNGLFVVPGDGAAWYIIAAVRAPGVNASGRWELTLSVPYQGATNAAAGYGIHVDFTPTGIPLLNRGDVEMLLLINRALVTLANGGIAPLTPQVTVAPVALSAVLGTDLNSLQGQDTKSMTLRTVVDVVEGSTLTRWLLREGSDVHDGITIVRPQDWADPDNTRVFQKVQG